MRKAIAAGIELALGALRFAKQAVDRIFDRAWPVAEVLITILSFLAAAYLVSHSEEPKFIPIIMPKLNNVKNEEIVKPIPMEKAIPMKQYKAVTISNNIEYHSYARLRSHETVSTAFIVSRYFISAGDDLRSNYGGFATVLLTDGGARSDEICAPFVKQYVYNSSGMMTIDHMRYRMRPFYWFLDKNISDQSIKDCGKLLSDYDFGRASALEQRLDLSGQGPFLVVANFAANNALSDLGTWDLSGVPDDELKDAFREFIGYYNRGVWRSHLREVADRRQKIKSAILRVAPDISQLFGVVGAPAEAKKGN